tara:strand:- start:2646 stop:3512 length:867 start_codon:yes stop_codon:yes gene_type:complete
MNDDQSIPPAPQSEASISSPGRAIREARERAGMSIDELGSRTRLSRPTLEAMETDAFERLLEPVYVRGYYRKCARILEIPEEPLIDAYEALYTPPPKVVPARLRLAPSGDLNASPRSGSKLLVIVPILAAVLLGVFWLMRQAPTQSGLGQSVTLIDPENSSVVISDAMPPIDDVPEVTESVESIDQTVADSAAAVSPPPAVEAAPVGTALQLEFKELSWARIEDASGKNLLSGVISAGETRTLDGKPPYAVFLGNAPGVKVQFGGIDIDVTPHTKANSTARFSVPAAG